MCCGLLKAEAGNRGSHRVPERFDWHGAGSAAGRYLLPLTLAESVILYMFFKNKHQKDL